MGRWAAAITTRLGAALVLLGAVAVAVLAFATSPTQPSVERTDGLPEGRQSTRVVELTDRFASGRTSTAIVVFERRDGRLTPTDQATMAAVRTALLPNPAAGPPPITAPDGQAALLAIPVDPGADQQAASRAVDDLRSVVRSGAGKGLPAGLTAQVTGGPAFQRDIAAAFDGANITLLATTATVVAILLLLTYRSPILWVVPLVVIGVADQVVAAVLPWVGRWTGNSTEGQINGIVSVLVFGAGTDYALLLIARYREELRRADSRAEAMRRALVGAAPAIMASAATVILAVLTLLAAILTGNRALGLSAAVGVLIALVFGLAVLPAVLVFLPRGVFWPLVPRVGSADPSATGLWSRVAAGVGRRPAAVLTVAVLLLAGLSAGLLTTRIGLSQTQIFRTTVESVTAQTARARHFPAGASQPAEVVSATAAAPAVAAALTGIEGVAAVNRPERSDDGQLTKVTVDLDEGSGTAGADRTVARMRAALADLPGANVLVGGAPAEDLDNRDANIRDNFVIAPLILAVVLLVLILLLRSVLAPVLLLLTVIASYAASLGAATLILRGGLDVDGLAPGVPLLSFLFLVALGVDYNIFLVTRAREETVAGLDTRAGVLRALATTGGVITSAGVLLAAVFAVLGVLPVIVLTQIGVIVGVGVLLDTLVVRTLVVPAIALLLDHHFWWPARIGRRQAS